MNKKEAKIEAITQIWQFACMLCEGIEKNDLSDNLKEDVDIGRCTKIEAKKIQKAIAEEADLLFNKKERMIARDTRSQLRQLNKIKNVQKMLERIKKLNRA